MTTTTEPEEECQVLQSTAALAKCKAAWMNNKRKQQNGKMSFKKLEKKWKPRSIKLKQQLQTRMNK